jgi:cytochrome c5
MQKLALVIAGLACILAPLTFALAGASSLDGEQLVKLRCNECHNLQRIQAAEKSRQAWESTVDRMIKRGAKLNEEEQEAVLDYLSQKDQD